jgi:EmrB/QacA subfamily drug resistance transporter
LPKESRSLLRQSSVAIACLSALLGSLDSAINIGFPTITAAFSLEVTAIQWVIVGYVLTHASLLPGCGGLADLWGHERVMICGLLVSAMGFTACGLATSYAWLVGGRMIQGLGAALVFAAAPALVTLAVPGENRGRALGIYQMSNAVGYAVGPLIGGILIDSLGWRATFLFRVLPALFLAWLAAVKLASLGERKHTRRFDFFSALTLAGGIAAGLLTLSRSRALGWSSPQVVILAAATIACFAGFVVVKARAKSPMVELTVIRLAPFIIANVLSVMANCARFAVGLLLPFYVINVLKYPAATGGTLMLATYLLTIVAAPLAGKLSERIGTARLSSSGLAVQGLGLWMLSRLNGQTDYLSLAFTLGFVGLGLGIFEAPNMNFIMGAIPRTQQGVAGSIANMMRPIGIVLGATGWSLLFDQRQQSYAPAAAMASSQAATGMLPALQDVFLSAAGLCFVACVLSLFRNGETSESNVRAES